MSNQQTEIAFGTQFIESGSLTKITKNPHHIREFETLNGIPDLILVSGSKLETFKRFEEKYTHIGSTSGTARILVVLNKKSYCEEVNLVRLTGLSKQYINKILKDLKDIGAVQHNVNRGYRIAKDFEMPSPKIISIEFKLDNWQKALVQATRHRSFASRSYVIMPSSKHNLLTKNIEQFIKFGISVGTFNSKTNNFEVIWKAPANITGNKPKSRISYIDSLYRMLNSLDRLETTT